MSPAPTIEVLSIRAVEPTEVSKQFLQGMADRMAVSRHKYGAWATNAGKIEIRQQIEERWDCYMKTGNTEWLMDVANLAMMEHMFPQVPGAYFRATDSHESPGTIYVDGSRTHVGESRPT